MNLKSLAKDTAIYGLSSIVGRFLNYLLVILYTYKIPAESGGYGIVTNLYAYSALLFALLTFGMETTFFRFASKDGEDAKMVYSTALRLVAGKHRAGCVYCADGAGRASGALRAAVSGHPRSGLYALEAGGAGGGRAALQPDDLRGLPHGGKTLRAGRFVILFLF